MRRKTIVKTILICALSIVLGTSVTTTMALQQESIWSNNEKPMEKRAYTYVSEYKRLPVYNFGLGKRAGYLDADYDKVIFFNVRNPRNESWANA